MALTDEEADQLKRDAAEAKAEAKRAAAEQARMQQAYAADMRIIGDELSRRQQPAPVAAAPEPEDDGELTEQKVNRIIEQRISPAAAAIGHSILGTARQMAAITIPEFNRYAPEVDQLVARALQTNPGAATDPNVYRHAYDVVRLQHQDEIIAERSQAEVRRRMRDEYGVEVEDDHEPATTATESDSASTPPRQARRPFAEAPTAPVSGGRALPPLKRRTASRFSEEQEFVNSKLGFRDNDKFDEYADSRYSPDILGLKGRERA